MKLINVPSALPEAVHLSNQQIGKFIIDKIAHLCEPQSAIAVIGLAYKGGTSVTEEAFGLELCKKMLAKGHKVFGWDR